MSCVCSMTTRHPGVFSFRSLNGSHLRDIASEEPWFVRKAWHVAHLGVCPCVQKGWAIIIENWNVNIQSVATGFHENMVCMGQFVEKGRRKQYISCDSMSVNHEYLTWWLTNHSCCCYHFRSFHIESDPHVGLSAACITLLCASAVLGTFAASFWCRYQPAMAVNHQLFMQPKYLKVVVA